MIGKERTFATKFSSSMVKDRKWKQTGIFKKKRCKSIGLLGIISSPTLCCIVVLLLNTVLPLLLSVRQITAQMTIHQSIAPIVAQSWNSRCVPWNNKVELRVKCYGISWKLKSQVWKTYNIENYRRNHCIFRWCKVMRCWKNANSL